MHSQSNTGTIQCAHGTENPPSGDPDVCSQSHYVVSQSQDARSSLQSTSGVPVGSEGLGVEPSSSACNMQTAGAQLATTLQAPPTALGPQQPLQILQPPQSVDAISIASSQPAALDSAAAVFAQLVTVAAANLAVTLAATPDQDSLGIRKTNATIAPANLGQGNA